MRAPSIALFCGWLLTGVAAWVIERSAEAVFATMVAPFIAVVVVFVITAIASLLGAIAIGLARFLGFWS